MTLNKIGRYALAILLFVLVGFRLSDLVRQKWNYVEYNAAQVIVQGYYREPKDSLDVLFLGASTIRNGMSPLQMYEDYGFTSYSRASSIQTPMISYNILLETLEKQNNIKAVVIDATTLSQVTNDTRQMEGKFHEAIDYMPMSKFKMNIIKQLTAESKSFGMADFLFPLYRYHERWTDVSEQDYTYHSWNETYYYKGQYPILKVNSYHFPSDYMQEGVLQDSDFYLTNEAMNYFDKITEVCKGKGIHVILVKTPVGAWDWHKHDSIQKYADLTGIPFIDFNISDVQEKIGFDPERDFCDEGRHPNISGAYKMSRYMGEYLKGICDFEDKRNNPDYDAWNECSRYYERLKADRSILEESNLLSYLSKIDDPDYTVIIAARNDTSKYFTADIRKAFAKLGLTVDMKDNSYSSYVAVISGGSVVFEQQAKGIPVNFFNNVNGMDLAISSFADRATGNNASIYINGEECSLQQSGFNIIVYDTVVDQIISRRSFDTGRTGMRYLAK